jgi:hypothetical protein
MCCWQLQVPHSTRSTEGFSLRNPEYSNITTAVYVLHMEYGIILVLYPNVNKLADKVKKLFTKPQL